MRLYPVVPMGTVRQAPAGGMQLGGHAIPPGAMLWVFFSAMFRSPHVWDAPDEFRPVRPPTLSCGWYSGIRRCQVGVLGYAGARSECAQMQETSAGMSCRCLSDTVVLNLHTETNLLGRKYDLQAFLMAMRVAWS